LHLGDCLEYMRTMPDKSVDAVITDPPYLYFTDQKFDIDFKEDEVFLEWRRILKNDSSIVIFGRGESFHRWNYKLINEIGFKFKEEIIWNKGFGSSPHLNVYRVHETISILTSGKAKINKTLVPYCESKQENLSSIITDIRRIKSSLNNTNKLEELISYIEGIAEKRNSYEGYKQKHSYKHELTTIKNLHDRERSINTLNSIVFGMKEKSIISINPEHYKYEHPTQKPTALIKRLINLSTQTGQTVIDPFMGSGTTGVACVQTNRSFIGVEIDPGYFAIAQKRIAEAQLQDRLF
jgi:site-specific DNA-methyltransferase (adenine-specific)